MKTFKYYFNLSSLMSEINAFGQEIPEIKEILRNQVIRQYISNALVSVLNELEIDDPNSIVDDVLRLAESYETKEDYELQAHQFLERQGVTTRIPEKLSNRADLIYSQIQEYVSGSVLDLGCGDGKVGALLAKDSLEVMLADVYKHDHVDSTRLDFVQFKAGKRIPIELQYDTTLVLTVLHHSSNPYDTIEQAKRLTKKGGRIIVIESVYGIEDETEFGKLGKEEQRLANIFFDHFYNRVIHYSDDPQNKVNVPFNFRTPPQWKEFFEQHELEQEKVIYLGQDQPTVPEYHTLHVLRV